MQQAALFSPDRTALWSHRRRQGRTRSSSALRRRCAAWSKGAAAAGGHRTPRAPDPPAHPPGPTFVFSLSRSPERAEFTVNSSSTPSTSAPRPDSTSAYRTKQCIRVIKRTA